MKVGIDATCITTTPEEGKDQVIYNLLRGLHELGHGRQVVVFGYSFLEERLRQLLPDGDVRIFRRWRRDKELLQDLPLRTFLLPRSARQTGLDVLLFPKSQTGFGRFEMPTVVIPHDIQCRPFPERFSTSQLIRQRAYYAIDFRLRDKILAISDFDAQEIRHYYPAQAAKVVRVYNPIQFATPEADGGTPHPRPYLLSINHRYPHKNTITLLRAFDALRDRIPHDLVLVGKIHPASQHLIDFVQQQGLGQRVLFTGYVEESRLHRLIRGADLYVNTSLYEGFGMPPIEAMGMGTPVLSTRDAAVPETTRGLAEYYGPSRDPQALANKLLEVLAHPPSEAQRRRIQEAVHQAYDYRVIAAEYWKLFAALATRPSGAAAGRVARAVSSK
ncbi:MAG TPA: glycosyltransferase family 1 protein [Gammaproteobacteria bacterium]